MNCAPGNERSNTQSTLLLCVHDSDDGTLWRYYYYTTKVYFRFVSIQTATRAQRQTGCDVILSSRYAVRTLLYTYDLLRFLNDTNNCCDLLVFRFRSLFSTGHRRVWIAMIPIEDTKFKNNRSNRPVIIIQFKSAMTITKRYTFQMRDFKIQYILCLIDCKT